MTDRRTAPRTPSQVLQRKTEDVGAIVSAAGDELAGAIGMAPAPPLREAVERLVARGFDSGWAAREPGPKDELGFGHARGLEELRGYMDRRFDKLEGGVLELVGAIRRAGILGVEEPGSRVLVVEDDPAIVNLYQRAAETGGLEVVALASAEAAVDWIERELPRCVVLDLDLAGSGTGFTVLGALRSRRGGVAVPVYVASQTRDEVVRLAIHERNAELGGGIVRFVGKAQAASRLAKMGGNGHRASAAVEEEG